MPPEFMAFRKIPRLSREIIITEKIDGTNAQVHVDADGTVTAGSRTRWITPEKDNFGFATWVRDHAEELCALGPGSHFGEWWGPGIQRSYGIAYKKFSLFNVSRWGEGQTKGCVKCGLVENTWAPRFCSRCPTARPEAPSPRPSCCDIVPLLYKGEFDTTVIDGVLADLARKGSVASPGFMRPEGVVVFHVASGQLFKKTLDNDDEAKSKNKEAA